MLARRRRRLGTLSERLEFSRTFNSDLGKIMIFKNFYFRFKKGKLPNSWSSSKYSPSVEMLFGFK